MKTGGGSGVGRGTYPGCACACSIMTHAPNTTHPPTKSCVSAIRSNLLVGIAVITPIRLLAHQLRQLGYVRRDPLLAARKKRQGQNRLPSLIFYHHHQRQIILVAVLFSQLSDRVLGIRKCRRYIRQVCVTRMVLDPILSVYRKGISWHRTFQNPVTATAANKNEPQARYVLKGSFVTSVGFGAERPGVRGMGLAAQLKPYG